MNIFVQIGILIILTGAACFWGQITAQTVKNKEYALAMMPATFASICVGMSHFIW